MSAPGKAAKPPRSGPELLWSSAKPSEVPAGPAAKPPRSGPELLWSSAKPSEASAGPGMPWARHPVLARGFRPFFLGVGAYGGLAVLWWAAIWRGELPAPGWLAPSWWHAHEMLFGVVGGAIAGFLLTAVPVWTGAPALAGGPLLALAALWAAARLALLAAGRLPPWAIALVDFPFLPAVAAVLARALRRSGQLANQGVAALVALLALANAGVHAQALGICASSAPTALRFAADAVVALIVLIGGRITPAFTANALRRRGVEAEVRARPWLDRLAVACAAALAAVGLVAARSAASGALALAAGLAVAARMAGWQTRRTLGDPLLWSLHAGMAWVAAGLLLVGAADLGAAIPATAGLHALSAGAMGTMILAVMTRVALGHTGRPLVLPRGAVACYALVHAGAVARVAAACAPGAGQAPLLLASAGLWAAAFWLFAAIYAPILLAPRVDGRPG
jgi:uncharacterized protein involved in response to NO